MNRTSKQQRHRQTVAKDPTRRHDASGPSIRLPFATFDELLLGRSFEPTTRTPTAGLRILRGRGFTAQKRSNPPSIVVRTANPGMAARAVEDVLRRIDPRVRATTTIVRNELDAYLGQKRMLALLSGPAAVLALVLAGLGVYGVTAFVVSQRTHEVSVRMALGASKADVLRLLVEDSLRPVIIGLVVGLAAALVCSRISASLLAGISPHDPLAVGLAATTLLAGALVAVVAPASRVANTDPANMLRQV